MLTYQRRAQEAAEVVPEVPSLGLGRVLLRAPEDVGQQDVDMLLVPVREVGPERELFRRVGARHAVAEVQARRRTATRTTARSAASPTPAATRTLVSPTCTTSFFAGSGFNEPVTRLPSNVSTRNCRSLSIDAIVLPLDLEIGIRVVGRERQHVLLDALDLAHQPLARGRDHHVLGRVRDARAAQEHGTPDDGHSSSVTHSALLGERAERRTGIRNAGYETLVPFEQG